MPRGGLNLKPEQAALVIVDMQRYYLEPEGNFCRYFETIHPGAMEYIVGRCRDLVIPNLQKLLPAWRERGSRVIYLRLCGDRADRSDLHPSFREIEMRARKLGFSDVYPLRADPYSAVSPLLAPQADDREFCKTTYSGFTSSELGAWLRTQKLKTLVFTGLATSQCVETTARDAADRGYHVVHLDDAQADYEDLVHRASLYSSQAICGGHIYQTEQFLGRL